jgi:uncharacterized protein (TIGR00369 family)
MELLKRPWDQLRRLPAGKAVFSRLLGVMAPYTGTIHPQIEELRHGHARVSMRDRRGVRNHLKSVHAVALVNLAELTGNMALLYGLPDEARAIVTSFSIDYLKKGRGRLVAECTVDVPSGEERQDLAADVIITDAEGDVVAKAVVKWRVGPSK